MCLRSRKKSRYNNVGMNKNRSDRNDTSPWSPGTILPQNFRVVRQLGQGGMGTVYLVERPRFRHDPIYFAVKIVRDKIVGNEERQERFIRELRNWISLPDHPHLAACRFFRSIENRLSIFSEFVDGGSMAEWVSSGRLGSRKVLWDLAIQSAWGLAAAHECGVLHLDIKPSNLLIRHDGILKITDFGLSLGPADRGKRNIDGTDSGSYSSHGLTPSFASPEQTFGQPMGPQSDQWSWGVTVLYGFTGSLTWKLGATIGVVLKKMKARYGTEMIPEPVYRILDRCFQDDPLDRWPDMMEPVRELVRDYEQFFGEAYPRSVPEYTIPEKEPEISDETERDYGREVLTLAENWRDRLPQEYKELISDLPDRDGSLRTRLLIDLAICRQVTGYLKKISDDDHPEILNDLFRLLEIEATVCRELDDLPGSLSRLQEAICLHDRRVSLQSREKWFETAIDLKSKLGSILMMSNRSEESLQAGRDVESLIRHRADQRIKAVPTGIPEQDHQEPISDVPVYDPVIESDTLDLVRNKLCITAALGRLRRLEESLAEAEESIDLLLNRNRVSENPRSLRYLAAMITNRAATLGFLDRDEEAAWEFLKAADLIRILIKRYGLEPMKHRLIQVYIDGARAFACADDLEQAERLCRKTVTVLKQIRPRETTFVRKERMRATEVLIQVLHEKGKSRKALRKLDSLMEVMENEIYNRGDSDLYRNLSALLEARILIMESLNDTEGVRITKEWQRQFGVEMAEVFGSTPGGRADSG